MTTLAITPNWKNKSAKFKGTVAAGEHVSVTILNENGEGGEFIADASTLRLRVVNPCNGRTLAIFPEPVPEGETPETWDSDLSPLRCTLNLNTVQMLKAVPPAANVPLLFVLDDYDNNTLYFKEQFPVEHWPRLRGEEEPTDLDNYKDIIADFNTRLDGYDTRITGAENAAQAATANASAAAAKANQAVGIANQAVDKAETAQNSAAASAAAAHNSALAAEEAQEAAESAAESINSPDATLTEEGVAADAKAAGEAIAAEETRAKAAEAAEKARAEGVESGLDTRLTAAEKAIDDEAVLRAAADADLEANKADKTAVAAISSDVAAAQTAISNLSANKADKATTYTKTEVDTKIAGVQTFQKYLVNELPDPDEADMKGLYLVPTGETSEEGDLCEEWTVVEEDGEKRWEKIGAKAVDLTLDDTVTSSSANGVKSSGIWAAIWGTASTAFSSLYDWAVAQLGLKRDYTDLSYDTTETVEVPALHVTMRNYLSWQVIAEYDFLCTEEVPDPPQMGHVYTWRADGAEFYITQGVSALQTTWILYSQNGEVIEDITTQNATQGFYPDVDFIANAAVITTHKTTVQKQVAKEDTIALESKTVPTSRTVNGTPLSSNVTLTGADIAVSGTDATKINAALAGKLNKSGGTITGDLIVDYHDVTITDQNGIRLIDGPVSETSRNYIYVTAYFIEVGYEDSEHPENNWFTQFHLPKTGQEVDFLAALSNIAPTWESGTAYTANALVTYDGVVYRCKADTASPHTATPDADTTHWEAKPVSELFLPLTGGTAADITFGSTSGPVRVQHGSGTNATLDFIDLDSDYTASLIIGQGGVIAIKYGNITEGNVPKFDSQGRLIDSGKSLDDKLDASSASAPFSDDSSVSYPVGSRVTYNGKLYKCVAVTTGGTWDASKWTADTASNYFQYALTTKTVDNGAVTLDDRAMNAVAVSSSLASLTINFPTATSGKARDFGLRLTVASGITTAPQIVLPQGVTCENADGEAPEIGADGAATILYFTETASGVFLVKGEVLQTITA